MATFEAQVNGITNLGIDGTSTDPGQSELTQFLKDGVIDVTNRIVTLRPQDIENFQRESATIDSNSGLDVGGAKIISVIREAGADGSSDGSTAWEPCGKISASMQSKVVNIDSLHYASQYHPKYIIDDNGKVNVYPVASANNGYKVFFVNNVPTDETNEIALVYSHSDIKWFPNDKVYLVVIYAGIKSLQASLASASISTFSLTSVPPDIPTLSESSVTITGTAPTYTAPSLDASSDQITEMEAGTIGSAQTDTEQWFDIAGDFIEIEEDTELAAAQLQKISAYLQTYSAAMQNQLNIFNDANVEYQAKLQKNIKDADFDSQEEDRLLQKYGAEVQEYQIEVAAEIQTYQQELAEKSAEYQWKTARLQDLKQEYNQAFAIMVPPQAKQQQARQRAS
tara:strand:- start:51 stop:1238 length:1188 start_codon:yes stop_codon:yes gene_type:complete